MKFIATEIRTTRDLDYYYNSDDASEDLIFIGGNDELKGLNDFTKDDFWQIADEVLERGNSGYSFSDMLNTFIVLLEQAYNKKFTYDIIRGCCQRDWNYIVYPEDKADRINWIKAVYFNTGTEFDIDIDECNHECLYLTETNPEQIRAKLRTELGIASDDDLIINIITDEYQIIKYEYKQI